MKLRRVAAGLAAVGLLFVGRTAAAEYLKTDCGPAMSLQRNAPWATGGGCATNLRMSYGMGQFSSPPTSNVQSWLMPFPSPPRRPAIMADDTIVLAAGTKLYAFAKSGVKRWEVELGQTMAEAPAIGADGTIYIGAANGNLFARNSNGTAKWTYTNSALGIASTSVASGLGGRLFVGGSGARVAAVNPNGTQAWIATVIGTPFGDMAMSHDGEYLYVSTTSGMLYSINTETGAIQWSKTLGTNAAVTSMVVNRWGVPITASFDGKLTAYLPSNGLQLAQRTFTAGRFKQIALDQRGFIYALAGYPNEAGQVTKLHVLYQDIFFTEAPGFSSWDFMPSNAASLQAGLVIDGNGMVWGNFRSGELVAVNRGGFQQFSYAIGAVPAFNTIVMNNDGTLVFTAGNNLFSRGPGRGSTNDLLNYVPEARKVPFALGSPPDPIKECVANGGGTSGAQRPGFTWTTSNNRMATLSFSGANDTGCPITFCSDSEVPFTNATGAWTKLINPNADLANPLTSLPNEYRQLPCPSVPVTKPCTAVNPSGIRWSVSCTTNSNCLTTEVCAAVCPNDGTGKPQEQCDTDTIIKRCADLDEQRCLAALPAEAQCHEVRECGEAEDRLNVTESTPTCDNGQSCNVTKSIVPPTPTGVNTAAYPTFETWNTAEPPCKLIQLENVKKFDNGGKNSNSGRTNKDWGLFMGANSTFDFDLKPLPFGFVMPQATAMARFDAVAKVMGKEFGVLEAMGTAQAIQCKFQAQMSTKLFGQAFDALNWTYGDDGTAVTSKCKEFFSEMDARVGNIKTLLMRANRIEAYLKEAQANNYAPAVTKQMCERAFGTAPTGPCNQPYTAQRAKDVADFYINQYRNQVTSMLPNNADFNGVKQILIQHLTNLANKLGSGVMVNQQTGAINWTRELLNFAQPFNVLGATAQFPIGPLLLTLEVNGQGEWGIKGFVELGVGFLPPNPGIGAGAVAEPFAHVDVDVYLGVGFGIAGLASLTVGFGGELTLVDVRTPLRGSLFVGANTVDTQFPSRAWPNAFRRFQIPGRTPLIPAKQYTWGTSAKLNAAVVITVLSGKLDMRVRIRFAFISKTWKKVIAEWAGKTWDFDWAGSFGVPIDMPAVTLPVLDAIPFPDIRTTDITTALWPNIPVNAPWPTLASLPAGTGKTRADILEKTPNTCLPGPLN